MSSEYLQIACEHCGGAVEAPRSSAGTTVVCPHCSGEISVPKTRSPAVWIGAALALVLIAGGSWAYVRHARKSTPEARITAPNTETNVSSPAEAKPKSHDDLKVGAIEIDQPKGSSLRYAVGTLKNDSDHPRYGISIELTLFDQRGQQLPTKASEYLQMLEPRKEWRFRALVLDSKAVSVKVSSIREEE